MKTVAIAFVHLDALMGGQSNAINSSLANNSGHRESVNSIKVDHPTLKSIVLIYQGFSRPRAILKSSS